VSQAEATRPREVKPAIPDQALATVMVTRPAYRLRKALARDASAASRTGTTPRPTCTRSRRASRGGTTGHSSRTLACATSSRPWGAKVDTAQVQQKVLPGAATLLGFNEPNFYEQANLSAAEAATRWPGVQAVADAHGLRLVSPAVNFCGGGCHDTDPFAYLEEFFDKCPGCRVDALGVHIYVGCKGENGNHAQWLINHLKTYESRFTQPIWLTEFACSDAANPDEQRAFLVDAVAYLESDPRIERYAWFAGRADNVPHVDLLGADGELTALGRAYVDAPHNAACQQQ
jgi:Glycosyl hydrolase catalytic core